MFKIKKLENYITTLTCSNNPSKPVTYLNEARNEFILQYLPVSVLNFSTIWSTPCTSDLYIFMKKIESS